VCGKKKNPLDSIFVLSWSKKLKPSMSRRILAGNCQGQGVHGTEGLGEQLLGRKNSRFFMTMEYKVKKPLCHSVFWLAIARVKVSI